MILSPAEKAVEKLEHSIYRDKQKLAKLRRKVKPMLIPNFTLAGECEKGNRPSFSNAMPPVEARTRYEALAASLRGRITSFGAGRFGADMLVQVANDGPVSLVMRLT